MKHLQRCRVYSRFMGVKMGVKSSDFNVNRSTHRLIEYGKQRISEFSSMKTLLRQQRPYANSFEQHTKQQRYFLEKHKQQKQQQQQQKQQQQKQKQQSGMDSGTILSDVKRSSTNLADRLFADRFLAALASFLSQYKKQFRTESQYVFRGLHQDLIYGIESLTEHGNSYCVNEISAETVFFHETRQLVQTVYSLFKGATCPALATLSFEEQCHYLLEAAVKTYSKGVVSILPQAPVDLANPALWFPQARQLRRHIVMHVGPTNSGKTHSALQKLETAESGFFAGPLRLLAREVYERFRNNGIRCNLITGEEIIEDVDPVSGGIARISCGTVEMFPLSKEFDVVVLDEVQMISDPYRGWAWTQAFLGARAKEVHLCGEERSVALIRELVKKTGDVLEVRNYKRRGELVMSEYPVDLSELQKGDCVVAFSKFRILRLKRDIERLTDLKVVVVYGALPADTRVEQAEAFNSGTADVIVASDAIGMGLNLRIKRIVFSAAKKFDGAGNRSLTGPEVRQIAGRAGRFVEAEESKARGYVSAVSRANLKYISRMFWERPVSLTKACLWPPTRIWEEYMAQFPSHTSLTHILQIYDSDAKASNLFFSCDIEQMIEFADKIHRFNVAAADRGRNTLLLKDQIRFLNAPVGSSQSDRILYEFYETVAEGQARTIFDFSLPFELLANNAAYPGFDVSKPQEKHVFFEGLQVGRDLEETRERKSDHRKGREDRLQYLSRLESLHNTLTLFCWLSYRYPVNFMGREFAVELKNLCEYKISETLMDMEE